jgi:Uma2 family endonuclease
LRSPSAPLAPIEAKMLEYMENGARLGWLIDPVEQKVYIHKPGGEPVEVLNKPDSVSGDPMLPGFVLDLKPIWEPDL